MKAVGQYIVERERLGRRTYRARIDSMGGTPTPQPQLTIKCIAKDRSLAGISLLKGHAKLSKLQHPNLVQYRDFKETRQNIYLISEHEVGPTLDRLGRPLTIMEGQQVLRALVSCLNYLNEHNVLHYDIKAANIVMGDTPKLLNLYSALITKHNSRGVEGYVERIGQLLKDVMPGLAFLCLTHSITWQQLCTHPLVNEVPPESVIINNSEISLISTSDFYEKRLSVLVDELEKQSECTKQYLLTVLEHKQDSTLDTTFDPMMHISDHLVQKFRSKIMSL